MVVLDGFMDGRMDSRGQTGISWRNLVVGRRDESQQKVTCEDVLDGRMDESSWFRLGVFDEPWVMAGWSTPDRKLLAWFFWMDSRMEPRERTEISL